MSKSGLEKTSIATCQVEAGHPAPGRAVPEVDIAEDVHGPHQQVEEPPVAGALHNVTLLGYEPEGHHQPMSTWRGWGVKVHIQWGDGKGWGWTWTSHKRSPKARRELRGHRQATHSIFACLSLWASQEAFDLVWSWENRLDSVTCIRPYIQIPFRFLKALKDAVVRLSTLLTLLLYKPNPQIRRELHVDQLQGFFLYFKMNNLILKHKLNFKMTDKM